MRYLFKLYLVMIIRIKKPHEKKKIASYHFFKIKKV